MGALRHIAELDVSDVLARVPEFEKPSRHDYAPPGLLHKSVFLRCHPEPDLTNWLQDLPVDDWPVLRGWAAMQELLGAARCAIAYDPVMGPLVDHNDLGRVALSVIQPYGYIQWHVDLGEYAAAHLRFHIPLVTSPDCFVYAMGETRRLQTGHLTWLDTQVPHSAGNWGDRPRTHALFELRRA